MFSTDLGTLKQASRKLLISSDISKVFDAFVPQVLSKSSALDSSAGLTCYVSGGLVASEASFSTEAVSCFSKAFISDVPGTTEPCTLVWLTSGEELESIVTDN